jgi:hypothetical protein
MHPEPYRVPHRVAHRITRIVAKVKYPLISLYLAIFATIPAVTA